MDINQSDAKQPTSVAVATAVAEPVPQADHPQPGSQFSVPASALRAFKRVSVRHQSSSHRLYIARETERACCTYGACPQKQMDGQFGRGDKHAHV